MSILWNPHLVVKSHFLGPTDWFYWFNCDSSVKEAVFSHAIHGFFWIEIPIYIILYPFLKYCGWASEILHQLKTVVNIPFFIGFQPSVWWCRISSTHRISTAAFSGSCWTAWRVASALWQRRCWHGASPDEVGKFFRFWRDIHFMKENHDNLPYHYIKYT